MPTCNGERLSPIPGHRTPFSTTTSCFPRVPVSIMNSNVTPLSCTSHRLVSGKWSHKCLPQPKSGWRLSTRAFYISRTFPNREVHPLCRRATNALETPSRSGSSASIFTSYFSPSSFFFSSSSPPFTARSNIFIRSHHSAHPVHSLLSIAITVDSFCSIQHTFSPKLITHSSTCTIPNLHFLSSIQNVPHSEPCGSRCRPFLPASASCVWASWHPAYSARCSCP